MNMQKRVFRSICLACFITLLLTATLVISVIYNNSAEELKKEVVNQSIFISKALESDADADMEYIAAIGKESENRISLISPDGTVIYDSFIKADTLENHLDRPEIKSAISNGSGDATRLSNTLGEKTYYYAVKLNTGDILRVAATGKSAFGIISSTMIWIVLIAIVILAFAVISARLLTDRIIKPINNLNLEEPLSNSTYEELSPLLTRLEKQNQKIYSQLKELTARQQEFDDITGTMNEGLVIYGEKGNILFENNSAKRILGDAVGKSYLELCREVDYIKAIDSALSGRSLSVKLNKHGKIYQLSAHPVESSSHSYAAILFIIDITDKEQAEKMRREFSANVSHELKTPLTSIMGCAEIIENGIAKNEDIPRFAHDIHTEAARLLALIEDIIKLSRMDEGNLGREFVEVDLSKLCVSVINTLSEKAKTKNIQIDYRGNTSLIYGIEPILYEMVYNLCDNAINYNKDNGSVTVKLQNKNGKIILSVSDTGIGIAPEHRDRIFERFYRVDKSHSKDTGGTGLGLAIVKHAAMLHNAEIALESQEGKGTTIIISIPIIKIQ
jgi:two-component system phosphate regulon sensor histidine kinase PhoR